LPYFAQPADIIGGIEMKNTLGCYIALLLLMVSCASPGGKKSALLVIDMQNESVHSGAAMYNLDSTISNIQIAIDKFRDAGDLVVFVKYDGTKLHEFIPGTKGFEIIPELKVQSEDKVVSKTANDSFYNSKLEEILKNSFVGTIYVCGTETDFCVNSTIQSAISKEYNVVVLEDCHTATGKGALSGEQIVKYYNTIWKMMIPTKNGVEVKLLSQVEESNI